MKKAYDASEKKRKEVGQEFEKYKVNVVEAFKNAKDIVKAESRKEIGKLEAENVALKEELGSSKKLLEDAFKTASIERKKNEKSIRDHSKVFEKKIAALEKENKTLENAKEKFNETIAQLENTIKSIEEESVRKSDKKLEEFSKVKDAEIEEFKKSLKAMKKRFDEEKEKLSEKVKEKEKTLELKETDAKREFDERFANMEKEMESAKEEAKKAKRERDEKEEQMKNAHEENVALQSKFVQDKIKMQKLHDEENARKVQEKVKQQKLHDAKIEESAAKLKIAVEEKEKCEVGHNNEKLRLTKEHEDKTEETFKKLKMITEERSQEKAAWEDSLNKKDVALTKLKIELKGKEIEVAKTSEDFKKKIDAFKKDIERKATEVLELRSEKDQAFKKLEETNVRLDEVKEQMRGGETILASLKEGNKTLMEQKLVAEREFSKTKDKLFKSEANHEIELKEMETKKKALMAQLTELKSENQRGQGRDAELKVLRESVKKLEKDLKVASGQASNFRITNEKYQKLVEMHANEKETLEAVLADLRREINTKKEAVAILNQSLEKERADNEEKINQRTRKADLLQQLVDQTKAENVLLKNGLKEAEAEKEALKKDFEEMRRANLKLGALKAKPEKIVNEGQELLNVKRKRQDMEGEDDQSNNGKSLEQWKISMEQWNISPTMENLSNQLKNRNEQYFAKCDELEEYKENAITACKKILEQKDKNSKADRAHLELQLRSAQREKDMYKEGMFRADVEALEGTLREHKEVLEALEQMPAKYRRKQLKKLQRRREGENMEVLMKEEMDKEKKANKEENTLVKANVEAKVVPEPTTSFKLPSLPASVVIPKPAPSFKTPSPPIIAQSPAIRSNNRITARPDCPDTPRPNKSSSIAPRYISNNEETQPSRGTPFKAPGIQNGAQAAGTKKMISSGKATSGGEDEITFVGQIGSEGRSQEKVEIQNVFIVLQSMFFKGGIRQEIS